MSNTFLTPGTTTTITFLADHPIEGVNKFGAYKAYKVAAEDGGTHLFFPPKYLVEELNRLAVCRGLTLRLKTTEAHTRDGRPYNRIEIADAEVPASVVPPESRAASPTRIDNDRNGILASVALKAATTTRGIVGEPDDVLATADKYLAWLRAA